MEIVQNKALLKKKNLKSFTAFYSLEYKTMEYTWCKLETELWFTAVYPFFFFSPFKGTTLNITKHEHKATTPSKGVILFLYSDRHYL